MGQHSVLPYGAGPNLLHTFDCPPPPLVTPPLTGETVTSMFF